MRLDNGRDENMPKMRVLQMIGSLNIGGSQAFILNLYRNINRDEVQFDFILDHPDQLYYKDEVERFGGKVYYMPSFTGKNLFQVRHAWDVFFSQHPEYKILHTHVRSYASIYIPIAHKYGVKTVIHSHSTSNGNGISAFVKRIMQYPLRFQADYFMACSEDAGRWLFGEKVCKSNRYSYIPNGIELKKYCFSNTEREKLRSKYGFEDKHIFIHVGRFHEAKNHKFLLSIFDEINKRVSNACLVLVGDGELRDSIEKIINEKNLNNNVRILGYRDDIPELLFAADVFLFPSIWEGLGISVIEAQAAQLPCIVSDSVPSAVKISELCHMVSLNDIDSWLKLSCSNLKRKNVMSDIQRSGYDIKLSAQKIESIYEELYLCGE